MNATVVLQKFPGWVLWNSSGAAVLVLLILIVRLTAGRALSARLRSRLWLLVVVRLMIPLLPAVALPGRLVSRASTFMPQRYESKAIVVVSSVLPHAKPAVVHVDESTAGKFIPVEDGMSMLPASPPTPTAPILLSVAGDVPIVSDVAPIAKVQRTPIDWRKILLLTWLAGTAVLLGRLVITMIRLARFTRQLDPITDPILIELLESSCALFGVRRVPQLLDSDGSAPALVGYVRPRILLPASLASHLSLDEIRLIFLHELAHLKRRDVLLNYLFAMLSALHWFNPLLWIASHRMAADRELACDDAVLRVTSRRQARLYGCTLLKLVELLNFQRLPAGAVGVVQNKTLIQRRIDMIASYPSRTARSSKFVRAAALSLAIAAGVSAIRAQTLPETPQPPQPATAASAPRPSLAPPAPLPTSAAPALGGIPANVAPHGFTAEEIEPVNPTMAMLQQNLNNARLQVDELKTQGLTSKSKPMMIAAQAVNAREREIQNYVKAWNQRYTIQVAPDGTPIAVRKDNGTLLLPNAYAARGASALPAGAATPGADSAPLGIAPPSIPATPAGGSPSALSAPVRPSPPAAPMAGGAPSADAVAAVPLPPSTSNPPSSADVAPVPLGVPGTALPNSPLPPAGAPVPMAENRSATPDAPLPPATPSDPLAAVGGRGSISSSSADVQSSTVQNLRDTLAQLRGVYGPDHPQIMRLQQQLDDAVRQQDIARSSQPLAAGGMRGMGGGSSIATTDANVNHFVEDAAMRQANLEVNQKLAKSRSADFSETKLRDALSYIADGSSIDVVIDERAISHVVDVNSETISLHVGSKPMEQILSLTLRLASPQLDYAVYNGVVFVSSRDALNHRIVTRIYDVPAKLDADAMQQMINSAVGSAQCKFFDDKIVITAPEVAQRDVARLLAQIEPGKGPRADKAMFLYQLRNGKASEVAAKFPKELGSAAVDERTNSVLITTSQAEEAKAFVARIDGGSGFSASALVEFESAVNADQEKVMHVGAAFKQAQIALADVTARQQPDPGNKDLAAIVQRANVQVEQARLQLEAEQETLKKDEAMRSKLRTEKFNLDEQNRQAIAKAQRQLDAAAVGGDHAQPGDPNVLGR